MYGRKEFSENNNFDKFEYNFAYHQKMSGYAPDAISSSPKLPRMLISNLRYGNTKMNVFYFFYKISRRKLVKGGISVLYLCPQNVNSPYCS